MRDVISRPIQTLWGKPVQKNDISGLINGLLEGISGAALVCSVDQPRLLHVNRVFLDLIDGKIDDQVGKNLEDLFESIDLNLFRQDEVQQCMLKQETAPSLPVLLQPSNLETFDPWKLVKVIPVQEYLQSQRHWNEEIVEAVFSLLASTQEDEPEKTLAQVVDITHTLFDTNLVCIYKAESTFPEIKKILTSEQVSFFPDTLPSTDLIRLSTEQVWTAGKRVKTELHKAARQSDLTYVASVPLGSDKAMIGLFVVGGLEDKPPAILIRTLKLFAAIVGLNLEQAVKQESLRVETGESSRQKEELSSILDYMDEGLLLLTPDLKIVEINAAAELLLGYTKKEVIGQAVDNILISPERLAQVFENAVHGITSPNLESIIIHERKGQTFLADVKVIPVLLGEEVVSIQILIRDISEKENIRAQTRQLEQRALLGEFMGVFAHEVLNPINSISTGLQLMKLKLGEEHPNRDIITGMENDCIRLHHQMEALKNFAKPYEPTQEPLDLRQLLIRVSERWRPRMERLNISLSIQIDDNLPTVIGDWKSFEQVFTNLISNAIDAMNATGGILSIRASQGEPVGKLKQLVITVSDTGPGIPDDIRVRIFEPFVTSKAMGTGLGLAITKRIITAHRGSITVNSFPGGTVFQVTLPANEDK